MLLFNKIHLHRGVFIIIVVFGQESVYSLSTLMILLHIQELLEFQQGVIYIPKLDTLIQLEKSALIKLTQQIYLH